MQNHLPRPQLSDDQPTSSPPMRYRLRTLLIVMLLGGPFSALGWRQWQSYRAVAVSVLARQAELEQAKSRDNGSRLTKAAVRHAALRLQRQRKSARERSAAFRVVSSVLP